MIAKKQKNRKPKTKMIKKTNSRVQRVSFLKRFWLDKIFLNNGLFFWGLSSVLLIVLFLGLLSLLAAPNDVGITVTILPPPPTVSISASPNPVPDTSTTSTLSWSTTDATICNASGGWSGSKAVPSGTEVVGPIAVATTYTLTCTGLGGGPVSNSVTITIPVPSFSPSLPSINSFAATPASVTAGGSAILNWSSSNTTSCSSTDFAVGPIPNSSGSVVLNNLTATKTYSLTCTDGSNLVTSTTTITVIPVPTVDLNSDKTSAGAGETAKLTWITTNTTSCTASGSSGIIGWSGLKSPPSGGSQDIILPSAPGGYTYMLTCDGVSDSVMINVGLPPEIVNFNSDKASVKPSETATLSWKITGALSCSASTILPFFAADWTGIVDSTDNISYNKVITLPNSDGNYGYKLTCLNTYGSISRNLNINVSTAGTGGGGATQIVNPILGAKPISETFGGTGGNGIEITVTVDNSEITADFEGGINLSWVSKGADKCTASGVNGWSGDKPTSGNELIANPGIEGVYTYILTCENAAGQKTIAYSKITITQPQKIEGVVNIIETEVAPAAPTEENKPLIQETITAPINEALTKTGVVDVFSVDKQKSSWQNILTIIMALSLLGLIGRGIYGFYWARKNWGFVFNSQNGFAIANAKIEIRRSADNQIIQTILTDYKGRFRFKLKDLKDGNYRVNVEKRDYAFPSKLFVKKGESAKNIYLGNSFKLIKSKGLRLKIPLDPILSKQI